MVVKSFSVILRMLLEDVDNDVVNDDDVGDDDGVENDDVVVVDNVVENDDDDGDVENDDDNVVENDDDDISTSLFLFLLSFKTSVLPSYSSLSITIRSNPHEVTFSEINIFSTFHRLPSKFSTSHSTNAPRSFSNTPTVKGSKSRIPSTDPSINAELFVQR